MTSKLTNPKEALGANKLPLHLWPTTATAMGSVGMLAGMLKYGRSNFRPMGARASIYYDGLMRHMTRWFEGQDLDPDDGTPHLAMALANLAIIIDADAAGTLTDDRMVKGGYFALLDELTPHVARLKALHSDKHPHHYIITDSEKESEAICHA